MELKKEAERDASVKEAEVARLGREVREVREQGAAAAAAAADEFALVLERLEAARVGLADSQR